MFLVPFGAVGDAARTRLGAAGPVSRPFTRRDVLASALILSSIFLPLAASAHGVVGNRVFLSSIVGNDAFPDNALGLTMRRSDDEFLLIPAFEKQLSANSSLLFTWSWDRITPSGGQEGFGDLFIYYRQAAYISVPHEMELTLSPILVLPTGTRGIAQQGYQRLGAEVLLGKGLGDLPDRPHFKYLRPLALQAEAGYTGRIEGPRSDGVFGNLEVEYSLDYLDHFIERTNLDRPLVELAPYVQFNYAQSPIAPDTTTSPDFRLTPGVAYLGEYCELSVAAQVALNGAAQSGDRLAILGLVEIFYDNIVPALGWMPL